MLSFKHGPVADLRRAEHYGPSSVCLAYLNEDEQALVAGFVAEVAEEHNLRAGWRRRPIGGDSETVLIYQLRPHYERDFELKPCVQPETIKEPRRWRYWIIFALLTALILAVLIGGLLVNKGVS